MRITIAPDKFKNSLTSLEVCSAVKEGLLSVNSLLEIEEIPLADGGDGLIDAIQTFLKTEKIDLKVRDPFFRTINSSFLISEDRSTAYIEMSGASGLRLLREDEYNCLLTTSFGTGELIKAAIDKKVKKIVLGIGGSATNDGGIGMAAALGYKFLNQEGIELKPVGESLSQIARIDRSNVADLQNIQFEIACDVTNPLTGENGASKVYAPQKGADRETVDKLEAGMNHFAGVVQQDLGTDISQIPGSGAAGGLGGGCIAFLHGRLRSGIDLVLDISGAEDKIKNTDVVVSGEGKLDSQSINGKVISGVAKLCKKYNKPLILICGTVDIDDSELEKLGVLSVYSLKDPQMLVEDAILKAKTLLKAKARELGLNYL